MLLQVQFSFVNAVWLITQAIRVGLSITKHCDVFPFFYQPLPQSIKERCSRQLWSSSFCYSLMNFSLENCPISFPYTAGHKEKGENAECRCLLVSYPWAFLPGLSTMQAKSIQPGRYCWLRAKCFPWLRLRKQVESPRVIGKALHQSAECSLSFSPRS